MSNGYILLWRKSLDSLVWADAKLWRLWSWCLLRASWKQRTALLGRTPVMLEPGDLAVTLGELSAGTGLSQKEVRSCLALARKVGCMEVRGTARGMRIRVVNWQDYQRPGAESDPCPALSIGKGTGRGGGKGRGKANGTPGGTPGGTPEGTPGAGVGQASGTPSLYGGKKGSTATRKPTVETPAAAGAGQDVLRRGDCELFLAAYPRRTGLAAARAAWARLAAQAASSTPDASGNGLAEADSGPLPPLDQLLAAVARQARTPAWQREAGRYIPGAANWLLDQRWREAANLDTGVDQWLRQASPEAAGGNEP